MRGKHVSTYIRHSFTRYFFARISIIFLFFSIIFAHFYTVFLNAIFKHISLVFAELFPPHLAYFCLQTRQTGKHTSILLSNTVLHFKLFFPPFAVLHVTLRINYFTHLFFRGSVLHAVFYTLLHTWKKMLADVWNSISYDIDRDTCKQCKGCFNLL